MGLRPTKWNEDAECTNSWQAKARNLRDKRGAGAPACQLSAQGPASSTEPPRQKWARFLAVAVRLEHHYPAPDSL